MIYRVYEVCSFIYLLEYVYFEKGNFLYLLKVLGMR